MQETVESKLDRETTTRLTERRATGKMIRGNVERSNRFRDDDFVVKRSPGLNDYEVIQWRLSLSQERADRAIVLGHDRRRELLTSLLTASLLTIRGSLLMGSMIAVMGRVGACWCRGVVVARTASPRRVMAGCVELTAIGMDIVRMPVRQFVQTVSDDADRTVDDQHQARERATQLARMSEHYRILSWRIRLVKLFGAAIASAISQLERRFVRPGHLGRAGRGLPSDSGRVSADRVLPASHRGDSPAQPTDRPQEPAAADKW